MVPRKTPFSLAGKAFRDAEFACNGLHKRALAAPVKSPFSLAGKAFREAEFVCSDLHEGASAAPRKTLFSLAGKAFGDAEFACSDLHEGASASSGRPLFSLACKDFRDIEFACSDLHEGASAAPRKTPFSLACKAFRDAEFACSDLHGRAAAAPVKPLFSLAGRASRDTEFVCSDLHKRASAASGRSPFSLAGKAFGDAEFVCRDLHEGASAAPVKPFFSLAGKVFRDAEFVCNDLHRRASTGLRKTLFPMPGEAFKDSGFACRDTQKAFHALPIIERNHFSSGSAVEENLKSLVEALVQESTETEWLEFKKDNADAKMIGQDISALANGALLTERNRAYMVWGVDDKSHQIVGTTFSPYEKSIGNQELLSWLHHMLSDNTHFRFEETFVADKRVILLIIEPASQYPVAFQKEPYIRVGSYTKRLADEPKSQYQLWNALRNEQFELCSALGNLTPEEVEEKLDVNIYFQRLNLKRPDSLDERIKYLEADQLVKRQDNQLFSITNFGALLLANNFHDFPSILRKEIRVVQYRGESRKDILRSKTFEQGYATCVSELFSYLDALLPSSEPISPTGERKVRRVYPPEVVRELLINAIIHQDLTSTGDCVQCELFENRLEITNPGTLLVEKSRILDMPPKSRNVLLARAMRRMHFCEEMGTGWDRVTEECELAQLPSPSIVQYEASTKVIIYSHIDFFELGQEQKLWSCYLHACILWLSGKSATNSSLRERFGLDKRNASSISRVLGKCVSMGLLKLKEDGVGTKSKRYIPYWA